MLPITNSFKPSENLSFISFQYVDVKHNDLQSFLSLLLTLSLSLLLNPYIWGVSNHYEGQRSTWISSWMQFIKSNFSPSFYKGYLVGRRCILRTFLFLSSVYDREVLLWLESQFKYLDHFKLLLAFETVLFYNCLRFSCWII